MNWMRAVRHMTTSLRSTKVVFEHATLVRIQEIILRGEALHRGEVRLVVESALPFRKIRRGLTPRQRALDLFGTLRVWDTEENNGVLLYFNLCDRAMEIIADRGAARLVGDQRWLFACGLAQEEMRQRRLEGAIVAALEAIQLGLAEAYPAKGSQQTASPARAASSASA
jgi:uncharacterized membrane protein